MTLRLKKKSLEFTLYAKHYVWFVNTLVCACKVNLVLNKETCFEAIDGSGVEIHLFLTSGLYEYEVQIQFPAALLLRKRFLFPNWAAKTKYLVLSECKLLHFHRPPVTNHCTEWKVQALFICVQRTRILCMK